MTHALKYPPRKSLPSPVFAFLLLVFGAITVAAADFGAIPLAGGQGHDSTTQNITGLEGRLTREQIAEGKRRAQDWLDRRKKASASQRSLSKGVAQDSGSSETAKENRKLLFGISLALVLTGQAIHSQPSDADRQALAQLRAEAEKGGAHSEFRMGLASYLGQFGLATNYVEAVKWIRKAAEQNYARAHVNLGRCYENGQGVARDAVEAMNWYRKAAEQKAAQAQHNLGVCYAKGQSVATNHAEAATWFRKAAGQSAQW